MSKATNYYCYDQQIAGFLHDRPPVSLHETVIHRNEPHSYIPFAWFVKVENYERCSAEQLFPYLAQGPRALVVGEFVYSQLPTDG